VLGENEEIYAFMVFNAETLHFDLSEWITYRENSAFGPGEGQTIRADCGSAYRGFLHILLHEATHVVDFVEGVTPYLHTGVPATGERDRIEGDERFTAGVWRDFRAVHRRYEFDLRDKITYYGLRGGPRLSLRDAETIYGQLASTPFVSLYAATTAAEDLAELVAWYHISHNLGQPHRIVCTSPDGSVQEFSFEPDPVTEGRRAVLASFYQTGAEEW
jgi:hypothetical protein